MASRHAIEVRHFKWPRRATSIALAQLLGQDDYGRWLGVAEGAPWHAADGSPADLFVAPLVKVVPAGTWWTTCFHPGDRLVDVDLMLPVEWSGDVLEEVDMELDVFGFADGRVEVKDAEAFERLELPGGLRARLLEECAQVRGMVEKAEEPFGDVGRGWLAGFVAGIGSADA